jgi:hypothetical protein
MSKLVLNGDTSGSVTLDAPAVSGTTTLTLPTTSGTVITTGSTFAGTGPAFSVFVPSNLTITSAVGTKVAFSSEDFDTASCFNNTGSTVGSIPAYAFLPNVAGYYQFNVSINLEAGVSPSRALITLVKNGSENRRVADATPNPLNAVNGSALIYMNGTTDTAHVEAYIIATTARISGNAGGSLTYFSGCLARSA